MAVHFIPAALSHGRRFRALTALLRVGCTPWVKVGHLERHRCILVDLEPLRRQQLVLQGGI
jgi:hypothetical protein